MEAYWQQLGSELSSNLDSLLRDRILYLYPDEQYTGYPSLVTEDYQLGIVIGSVTILSQPRQGYTSTNPINRSKLSSLLQVQTSLQTNFEQSIQDLLIDLDLGDVLTKAYVKSKDFSYYDNGITFRIEMRLEDVLDLLPPDLMDGLMEALPAGKRAFLCIARFNSSYC